MPCGLDDVGNSLILQRRRQGLLMLRMRKKRLVGLVYTSDGGRLRDCAVARLTIFDRLIVQDKVLLGRQIQLLLVQLLRGRCRQARSTGGKPC